jgi:hypothetical protein
VFCVSVSTHVGLLEPAHAPAFCTLRHPATVESGSAVAVSVTRVPVTNVALHPPPQ